jgi:hypothetical protein
MGARELADLLDRASADVPPPAFAEEAWSRAFHLRRRRRSVVAVASVVAALVVTGGALHALRPDHPVMPPAASAPATSGPPAVDRIPARPGNREVRQLPAAGLTPPGDARALSFRPVTRAVAVFQLYTVDEDTSPQPLYVLDTDGTWARVDSVLPRFTRDADGNRADPLRPTAISPDRRLVAVAQTDEVLIIDVTSGGLHRVPLAGFNEQLVWVSDDVLLVTHDVVPEGTATYAVEWRAKTATRVTAGLSAWDTVVSRPGGPVIELGGGPVSVTEWRLDGSAQVRRTPVDSTALGHYAITEWHGPGLRNDGDLVVRAGFGNTPTVGGADLVAVVDVRTGVVRRLLELDRDRMKGCCQPLDWVDGHTVLLRTDREGLVTWDVRTGRISVVAAGPVNGTLAVALD